MLRSVETQPSDSKICSLKTNRSSCRRRRVHGRRGRFVSACSRCWPFERTCDCSRFCGERVSMLVVGGGGRVRRARGVLSVWSMSWEAMPVSARSNHDGVKVAKRRACGFPRPVEWTCASYHLVRVCVDAGRRWLCEACVRARGVLSVLGMSLEAMPVNAGSNHDGVKVTK